MGQCCCSDSRKGVSEADFDIYSQFQGVRKLNKSSQCESVLVKDRQTREEFVLNNIYTHSLKHPDAQTKPEATKLFETLRKGKHLNTSTVWQVGNSKLDFIYVVQEDLTLWHTLKTQLASHSEVFMEATVATVATELLQALDHLHTNLKIAHCAVDLEHVVCNDEVPDKNSSRFKLVDFENARFIGSRQLPSIPTDSETLVFYAPELLLREDKPVTSASDIWMLGVLIMRLMSGNFSFIDSLSNATDKIRIHENALNEALNSDIFSYSLRDFLSSMLVSQPDQRASAKQLLSHVWIQDMEKERARQQDFLRTIRSDFMERFRRNFNNLQRKSRQEWAILRIMDQYDLLELQYEELGQMFDALDLGSDDKVSIDEIISILAQSGMFTNTQATPRGKRSAEVITIDDVRSTLARLDFDHTSTIDFNEFVMICGDRNEMLSDDNLVKLFNELEADEHGKVPLSDVKTIFQENDNSHDDVAPDDLTNNLIQQLYPDETSIDLKQFIYLVRKAIGMTEDDETSSVQNNYDSADQSGVEKQKHLHQ